MTTRNTFRLMVAWRVFTARPAILLTSPANQGTYNYGRDDFSHGIYDVVPYWILGNDPDDPTPLFDRIFGPGTVPSF